MKRYQQRRNVLLDIVAHHWEDLLHKRVQLLLEEQGGVLGLNQPEPTHTAAMDGGLACRHTTPQLAVNVL